MEHGAAAAYYDASKAWYMPVLECLCGEVFKGCNWEEAGYGLDKHIAEAPGEK